MYMDTHPDRWWSMTRSLALECLTGPHVEDAQHILAYSAVLSHEQAVDLADLWEYDINPYYDDNCVEVQNLLAITNRNLPLGWFEATFADCEWINSTKALHAIADAVVATLVKDLLPHDVFFAMIRPWWKEMSKITSGKVDLTMLTEICLA